MFLADGYGAPDVIWFEMIDQPVQQSTKRPMLCCERAEANVRSPSKRAEGDVALRVPGECLPASLPRKS